METMRRALIAYNPVAGRLPVTRFIGGAARILTHAGWSVETVATASGEDTTRLAAQAGAEGWTAFFAAGGDGTIGQAAAGLAGTETALGVLPCGTANVLARELNLPVLDWNRLHGLRTSARRLAEGRICRIDVGECNGRAFVMWAGVGLDAITVKTLEPRVRLEKYFAVPEYAASTIWNASLWHGQQMQIRADEEEIEGHYLLAVMTNIRHYMGGLAQISPDAALDDGHMDLWLFAGDSLGMAFRHAFDLWTGRHFDSEMARRVPFHKLRIRSESEFAVQTDGEPLFTAREMNVLVRPRALRVLLPINALELLSDPARAELID